MSQELKSIFDTAFSDLVTPGGSVSIVKHGQQKIIHSYGAIGRGQGDNTKVTEDTLYDVASLTKPICTATLSMLAIDRGLLTLEKTLGDYLPLAKNTDFEKVTIKELLGHSSGLPAHYRFFERAWEEHGVNYTILDQELISLILKTPKQYETGSKSTYSDLGYILLGKLLESIYGAELDSIFNDEVAQKLGLSSTSFRRISKDIPLNIPSNIIAPTESCKTRGRLQGVVHDENCYLMDGVAGHAGLFSTIGDLRDVLGVWADSFHGDNRFINPETMRTFWRLSAAPSTSWKLGFDTPSPTKGVSHAGDLFYRSSIGHLGFTGTSFWLDPETKNSVIILTNRVYDSRAPEGIKSLRRAAMDSATVNHFGAPL